MLLVVADLGGTHVRFAVAELHPHMRPSLDVPRKYKTADFPDFSAAWSAFSRDHGGRLPRAASIAVAGPINADAIRCTNSPWIIRPARLANEIEVDNLLLLNDFGAMAAAVGTMKPNELLHISGPDIPLPETGIVTVVGPGTGLGVAQLCKSDGRNIVISTEGGHIDFAVLDAVEERIVERLRQRFVRVSTERIVSGPGLAALYEALAITGGAPIVPVNEMDLWQAAIDGSNSLAASALDRLVMALGAVAGDLALAHGAGAVVITGSLANRIQTKIRSPLFSERFQMKGRLAKFMAGLPVRLAAHPDPGLLGAASAFQEKHGC